MDDVAERIHIERGRAPAVFGLVLSPDLYPVEDGQEAQGQVIRHLEIVQVVLGAAELGDVVPDAVAPELHRILDIEVVADLRLVGLVDDRSIDGIEGKLQRLGQVPLQVVVALPEEALVEKGIDKSRLTLVPCGKKYPLWVKENEEWKARENRRVEAVFCK